MLVHDKYIVTFCNALLFGMVFFVSALTMSMNANAQEVKEPSSFFSREEQIVIAARQAVLERAKNETTLKPSISSLLFLPGEYGLLQAAKSSFLTRVPTDAELEAIDQNGEVLSSIREVSLGGILYTTEDRWVVWLNSQRVTPDAIPAEVLDISVNNEYIDLKWFDRQTNKIFPVRLRPNQRFNFDARMFLPAG